MNKRVTIWDMDWFYAKDRTNLQNPDAMRISSFHKQSKDIVNFVVNKDDINRPYDICYIIKENTATPAPPARFFMDSKVKWWGDSVRVRVKWKMSNAMLGCRPDYQLYPNLNTKIERSDHVRLFNASGVKLPLIQDWTNVYRNKFTIVDDATFWINHDDEDTIKALETLTQCKNISFSEPIFIPKLISNENIKKKFFELNITKGSQLCWSQVAMSSAEKSMKFLLECKKQWPTIKLQPLHILYPQLPKEHSIETEISVFDNLISIIVEGKKNKITIIPRLPNETDFLYAPYMFKELNYFMRSQPTVSWVEYITKRFSRLVGEDAQLYLVDPSKWAPEFRDLLRQTYKVKDFFLLRWGDDFYPEEHIPWELLERIFVYGI